MHSMRRVEIQSIRDVARGSIALPPGEFVSGAMVVAVMDSAQRYSELIADLEPHRARLGEPQMVGVGGASSTDQTGLRGDEPKVGFVAESTELTNLWRL
jgi:hypothetical protein